MRPSLLATFAPGPVPSEPTFHPTNPRATTPEVNILRRLFGRVAVYVAHTTWLASLMAHDAVEVLWTRPASGSAALAFSPDGRWLAAAHGDVDLWRVADGALSRTISNDFGGIMSLAFSPDSLQLTSGDDGGVVCVHSLCDGSRAWKRAVSGDVTAVAYSPDARLATWSSDRSAVDLWRTDTGSLSQSYTDYEWSHHSVAFSPDGRLVALGGDEHPTVRLLSAADGSLDRVLAGHTARVRTVTFSPAGDLLVTAGDDATIRLWRVDDGAMLRSLPDHAAPVWKVAVAPNGTLASSGADGTLRLWRMTDGALLRTYATGLGASYSLEFSPDGSLFAFECDGEVVVARSPVPAITEHPTRCTRFAGQAATFTVSATGDAPLDFHWKHNGTPLGGATASSLTLTQLGLAQGGTYTVEVSNALGTVESRAANLSILDCPIGPGALDVRFDPTLAGEQLGFGGGLPGIRAVVEEPDGRLVVGGFFAAVNGTVRRHLARLLSDGTLDPSFHPGLGVDGEVTALARQGDGSILAAGLFKAADGQPHAGLVRVDAAGTVDSSFQVSLGNSARWLASPTCVAVQRDGHIWVCGSFTEVNGLPCTNVARLNPDGTLDTRFSLEALGPQGNQWVDRVLVQPDDQVLLAGCWNNPPCSLIRLRADGTLDPSFASPNARGFDGQSTSHIGDLAVHWDGRIAMVGEFQTLNGLARRGSVWLRSDGTLDAAFNPGTGAEDSTCRALAIEPDGRLLVGGWFSKVQSTTRRGLARYHPDGSLDTTFDPGVAIGHLARPNVNALVRLSDGRYLVGADDWSTAGTNCLLRLEPTGARDAGFQVSLEVEPVEFRTAAMPPGGRAIVAGYFTSVNGVARPGLARLEVDGRLDPTFAPPADLTVQVWAIAVQGDGKVLVGGLATRVPGEGALARLEADGSVDTAFRSPALAGPSSMIETMALQPDGRILIGGLFSTVGGLAQSGVARLNADGMPDARFKPPEIVTSDDAGYGVEFIHVLANGRILIAGGFRSRDESFGSLVRLEADGSLDTSFVPGLPALQPIRALAVQADGGILAAGAFPNEPVWGKLLRLQPDGTADSAFHADVREAITALAVQADGRILVATNAACSGTVIRLGADGRRDSTWQSSFESSTAYLRIDRLLTQASGEVVVVGQWQSVGGIPQPGLARLNGDGSACHLALRGGLSATGAFPFAFIGSARGRFVIETSSDLETWTTWLELGRSCKSGGAVGSCGTSGRSPLLSRASGAVTSTANPATRLS